MTTLEEYDELLKERKTLRKRIKRCIAKLNYFPVLRQIVDCTQADCEGISKFSFTPRYTENPDNAAGEQIEAFVVVEFIYKEQKFVLTVNRVANEPDGVYYTDISLGIDGNKKECNYGYNSIIDKILDTYDDEFDDLYKLAQLKIV